VGLRSFSYFEEEQASFYPIEQKLIKPIRGSNLIAKTGGSMFAIKSRMEVFVLMALIAAILLNALALKAAPVQAEQESVSTKAGELESRSISAQEYISNCTLGLEGLCLAHDWWPFGPVEVDWTVQKSTGSGNKETLSTFASGTLSYKNNILHNFVGSIHYTVTPADVSNNWISLQLGGIQTSEGVAWGTQSAKFYVDIVSPSGLPVTCDHIHTTGNLAATCVQDGISHVHGMADSGPVGIVGPGFNGDGGYARVAVTGLTAGQELIIAFGSSCSPDTFEPDNTPASGSTLATGEDQTHSLCPQNDEDWADFQTSTSMTLKGNLLVETFNPDFATPETDTKLTVSDELSNQIGVNQDRGLGPLPGSSASIKSSRVVWNPAEGGVFNIQVVPQQPVSLQEKNEYGLRLVTPFTMVDPVDQASWGPTKTAITLVRRIGSILYITQYFAFDQEQLDALEDLDTTFAWEFRRPDVVPSTGIEIKDSNVDFGDYWRFMNGVCNGEYWTNLPANPTDEYSEEVNSIPGCEDKDEPGSYDDEEFELFIDEPSKLIADKVYFVTLKFYIHSGYLNNDYQFYVSKVEHCKKQFGPIPDILCNLISGQKSGANLIEGYLQPTP
jgi:hypothetical protein